jgi:hypothetical protein
VQVISGFFLFRGKDVFFRPENEAARMAFKKYATSAPVGKGFRPGVTDRAVCHEYMLHFENAG